MRLGLILAGGEGRRMGGADKGLLAHAGEPLVAHVARRLRPQVDALLISANRHPERYAEWSSDVLADARDGFHGPLAGIEAGLRAAQARAADALLVAPCDTPNLPLDLAARLHAGRLSAAVDGIAPAAVAWAAGRRQPVFLLLPLSALPVVSACLDAGERRMGAFLDRLNPVEVRFEQADAAAAFANCNTPDTLLP